jgi:hypothetical protein
MPSGGGIHRISSVQPETESSATAAKRAPDFSLKISFIYGKGHPKRFDTTRDAWGRKRACMIGNPKKDHAVG